MNTLINNSTDAETVYPSFSFEANQQVALFATGLSTGEVVTVEFSIDGTTWEQLMQYGVSISLTSESNAIGIYCPARLRIVKPITASGVSVAISTRDTNNF